MELGLNSLWLVFCCAALGRWGWWNPHRQNLRREWGKLTIIAPLAVALVLLFPAISISDDLHGLKVPMEEPVPREVLKCARLCLAPAPQTTAHCPIGFGPPLPVVFHRHGTLRAPHNGPAVRATTPASHCEIRGPPGS